MKKRKLLKYIILSKRFIQRFFKLKQTNVLLDNEKLIMELLFKDISTKESIYLYSRITAKFCKQLNNREIKAKSEIQTISTFVTDNSSNDTGKVMTIVFDKVLETQKI